jgi:hypothetical protein
MPRWTRWALTGLACLLSMPVVARAQLTPPDADEVPLGELVEVLLQDGEVVAVDAGSGGTAVERLRLSEQVLWRGTRGLLGVVLTDQRVLAIATGSSSWQEVAYERDEQRAPEALLGDRLAVIATPRRVIGFLGKQSRFVEARLGAQETLLSSRVGANVAVAVTDRKVLGLSAAAGGFNDLRLQLKERLHDVVAKANLATVRTNQRILVYRGPTGTWAERRD